MNWLDITTIVIATYGAIISTYLGIRELSKERRKVKIILKFVYWIERYELVVVNIGHRPITLVELNIRKYVTGEDKKTGHWQDYRHSEIFYEDQHFKYPFPVELEDGQSINMSLSDSLTNEIVDKNNKFEITVFDVEGNTFSDFEWRAHDIRRGTYDKVNNRR